MADPGQVAELVSDIYDAALDSSLWPSVLRRTMGLVEGVSAAIFSDAALGADSFLCAVDVDPHFAELYVRYYVQLNPLIRFEESLPAGSVFTASDGMLYEELCASPFFNEWARPQGFADFIGVMLEKTPSRLTKLIINRHESRGPVDPHARELMQLLAPHFRRAVAIGKALERNASKLDALGDVLERLSSSVVLVDRTGRLVHANGPAEKMLAAGEILNWHEGRPRPSDERAAAHLQAILAAAHRGQPSAECRAALSITHAAASGDRVTIHVLPLSAGTRRHAFAPCSAAAAILVSRCASDLTRRVQCAARLFALTPAESKVAQTLLTGCTIAAVARLLGITEATVKTHVQHIFDKTGTRRQVDLVQLIADCASPSEPFN